MTLRLYFLLALMAAIFATNLSAQGLRGVVIDQEGKPLPFSTIYVSETGSGGISNEKGQYELRLLPGKYNIAFQFLGYKTEQISVTIGDEFLRRDIILQQQAYLLNAAEIEGGNEDPAYKIMRKAIAKSSYHRQQIDSYTCEVYLKGGGRLVKAPWFARKMLEKEGIDTSATFVTESVSKIKYTRPGHYEEEVISIRSTGDDQNSNPMNYINSSLYEPKVAGIISPFSPKAFAYYRFRYQRTFADRGYQINEIKVIPRSRGEDVFEGTIFVVEDLWCIHSAALIINVQSIVIDVHQVFAPVSEKVWMPVSHNYEGHGKILGFEFEFQYLAVIRDYAIVINPDLALEFTVIDEKAEPDLAADISKNSADTVRAGKLMRGEDLTAKDLRKLMKEYEKEERKDVNAPQLEETRDIKIDSMASKVDSAYWALLRPVPLTDREIKGYAVIDSLSIEERKEREGDTLNTGKGKFKIYDIVMGNTYNLGNDNYLELVSPLTSIYFNTVDGWNLEYKMRYFKRFDANRRLEISPKGRYAFARNKLMGTLSTEYIYGSGLQKNVIKLNGGYYYSQFNPEEPISQFTNNISSLFVERNFMKVYDRNFVEAYWRFKPYHNVYITTKVDYSQRVQTFNNTDFVWLENEKRDYTPNTPVSAELSNTAFDQSAAFKTFLEVNYRPGARYGRRGESYYRTNRPPSLSFRFESAIPNVLDSDIEYQLINFEFKHFVDLNLFGRIEYRAEIGTFINGENMEFPDFRHFMGNETAFTRFAQMSGYSIAPYYLYSTRDSYLSGYFNYELRQFLFTNIRALRLTGTKENINVNYLWTPEANHYTEVGYSLDNLFRFFRIDATVAFEDGKYSDFRIQLGITSDIVSFD